MREIKNLGELSDFDIDVLLAEFIDLEKIETAIEWNDLNMSELDIVELIMKIENKFDIMISDELGNNIIEVNFIDFYNQVSKSKIRNDKLSKLGI